MNLLNKTAPWMMATLLATTTGFAQNKCPPKQDRCPPCTPCEFKEMLPGMPGYNAPSRINVCGTWDMYADASFVYWQIAQDNMSFAFSNNNSLNQVTSPGIQGNYVQMDFDYIPGFKVGGGINIDHDNWDSYAEYTRVHGSNNASTNGEAGGMLLANAGNLYLLGNSSNSQVYRSASSKFKTNLDFIDWVFGRNYFVGKKLTFHPVLGVRGAFITQSRIVHYRNPSAGGVSGSVGGIVANFGSMDVYSRVRSWGLGARTGVETNWMLGEGLRIFGNGYADMLYTKYKLQEKSIATRSTTGATQYVISKERVGAIRTHLDLELGFGWGSYFDDNSWHIDLSAGYGFQVFFDQNMFRQFTSGSVASSGLVANGDMTIQGLTATVRIDF